MRIKAFDKKLCCRGMQYKIGEEYSTDYDNLTTEDLCTEKVLHYCDKQMPTECPNYKRYVINL